MLNGPSFQLPAPYYRYGTPQQQAPAAQRPNEYLDQRVGALRRLTTPGGGQGKSGMSVSDALGEHLGRNTAVSPSLGRALKMGMSIVGFSPTDMAGLARNIAAAQEEPQLPSRVMEAIEEEVSNTATTSAEAVAMANRLLDEARAIALSNATSAAAIGYNAPTTEERNKLYGAWAPNLGSRGAPSPGAPSGSGVGHGMGIGSGTKSAGPQGGGRTASRSVSSRESSGDYAAGGKVKPANPGLLDLLRSGSLRRENFDASQQRGALLERLQSMIGGGASDGLPAGLAALLRRRTGAAATPDEVARMQATLPGAGRRMTSTAVPDAGGFMDRLRQQPGAATTRDEIMAILAQAMGRGRAPAGMTPERRFAEGGLTGPYRLSSTRRRYGIEAPGALARLG